MEIAEQPITILQFYRKDDVSLREGNARARDKFHWSKVPLGIFKVKATKNGIVKVFFGYIAVNQIRLSLLMFNGISGKTYFPSHRIFTAVAYVTKRNLKICAPMQAYEKSFAAILCQRSSIGSSPVPSCTSTVFTV